jgi:Putative DNA-binding domain
MPTYPEQLYDSLDEALIDQFITEHQEENLHLDFKLATAALDGRDDRKTLARALSGFANGDGGVIVWGVDARPNVEGIDCAQDKRTISPLSQLISKLNEYTGQAVNPLVSGILHRRIETGLDSGFAVTLVPASDAGPHMAKMGEDRYYKRSGSRFAKMEHYEVADMFGRRQKPELNLICRLEQRVEGAPAGGSCRVPAVIASLENSGRGSARAPYFEITAPHFFVKTHGTIASGVRDSPIRAVATGDPSGSSLRGAGRGDFIIHPGTAYEVAMIYPQLVERPFVLKPLNLRYRLTAENCQIKEGAIKISVKKLEACTPIRQL